MSRTAGVAARGLSFPSAPPPLFSDYLAQYPQPKALLNFVTNRPLSRLETLDTAAAFSAKSSTWLSVGLASPLAFDR